MLTGKKVLEGKDVALFKENMTFWLAKDILLQYNKTIKNSVHKTHFLHNKEMNWCALNKYEVLHHDPGVASGVRHNLPCFFQSNHYGNDVKNYVTNLNEKTCI